MAENLPSYQFTTRLSHYCQQTANPVKFFKCPQLGTRGGKSGSTDWQTSSRLDMVRILKRFDAIRFQQFIYDVVEHIVSERVNR